MKKSLILVGVVIVLGAIQWTYWWTVAIAMGGIGLIWYSLLHPTHRQQRVLRHVDGTRIEKVL